MPNASTQTRTHSRAGFFIVFLLLALHPEALLAGSLQGQLLDPDAGRPVSGAVLTLSAPSGAVHSVRSDTTGTFRLENLSTGTWDLRVERLGYRPLHGHVQIGAAPTSVELHLQFLPMLMDELVVRARRDLEGKHIAS
ncbi:MAG: carboxypeptidase-like regulatory domain-containing protein, partial [Gemmatimonadetes bacterium]|nr:carboxypeptidase-like regulatory domain-containing protein [Gemmatimonadota bacterium]